MNKANIFRAFEYAAQIASEDGIAEALPEDKGRIAREALVRMTGYLSASAKTAADRAAINALCAVCGMGPVFKGEK